MKNYETTMVLNFGKYKGKTLLELARTNFAYIEWCILNIDRFYVKKAALKRLANRFKHIKLSDEILKVIETKKIAFDKIEKARKSNAEEYHNEPDGWHNYNERDTYGQYSGTYAQDVEGLSDNFINDALGGEPDAYWNID